MKTKEYFKKKRYSTYETGYSVQLRDNKSNSDMGYIGAQGIVAVFPTVGGGLTTKQDYTQAVKLARKICRMLNAAK